MISRPPGEAMTYNNHNYDLLGMIVKRVSGRPLPDIAEERIFEPLEMKDTTFGPHWDMLETYIPGLQGFILENVPAEQLFIGLDERTAMCGDGEHWQVTGSGSVWISANGNELSPRGDGETIDLRLL